jgi:alkylated DNA repair dioxygenase AlkB
MLDTPAFAPAQAELFGSAGDQGQRLPEGFTYEPDFLNAAEEASLISLIAGLPLEAAKYKAYTARRKVISFGGSFDFDSNLLLPSATLLAGFHPLRERVASWLGVPAETLVHTLVAEYQPGTPLGWHRDVPDFEEVMGVSLGSEAVMRLRPFPPDKPKRSNILRLNLQPRSIYRMRSCARWQWQHSVAPVPGLRWSITFRTAAARPPKPC